MGTTIVVKFFIFNFSYLIENSEIVFLLIFSTFWPSKKQSRYLFTVKKIWFPYAPRSLLRKLLMPFYAKSNFDFGLFERDGMILDLCATLPESLTNRDWYFAIGQGKISKGSNSDTNGNKSTYIFKTAVSHIRIRFDTSKEFSIAWIGYVWGFFPDCLGTYHLSVFELKMCFSF